MMKTIYNIPTPVGFGLLILKEMFNYGYAKAATNADLYWAAEVGIAATISTSGTLVHPNSYMNSWNHETYEFIYEKIIWIHRLYEFIYEFIVYMIS